MGWSALLPWTLLLRNKSQMNPTGFELSYPACRVGNTEVINLPGAILFNQRNSPGYRRPWSGSSKKCDTARCIVSRLARGTMRARVNLGLAETTRKGCFRTLSLDTTGKLVISGLIIRNFQRITKRVKC